MNPTESYQKDLESIRQLMERSVKFLSLSGLSGILAGVYALIGTFFAYRILYDQQTPFDYHDPDIKAIVIASRLILIAFLVLVTSLATGYWLAARKAKRLGLKVWDAPSKRLVINLAIPLFTGGIFIGILLLRGYYELAAPASLVFYGLALIQASSNLVDEIRYLGYLEILIGLIAAVLPGYGLYAWALGFGGLHILYGSLMFKKYDS